jgi:hypothetical protein
MDDIFVNDAQTFLVVIKWFIEQMMLGTHYFQLHGIQTIYKKTSSEKRNPIHLSIELIRVTQNIFSYGVADITS